MLGPGEVVDEQEVVRRRAVVREGPQVKLDRGHPPGAGQAGHEDVEAQGLDREPELERAHRSGLADDPARRLDLRRGVGGQPLLGAAPPQQILAELSRHRRPLPTSQQSTVDSQKLRQQSVKASLEATTPLPSYCQLSTVNCQLASGTRVAPPGSRRRPPVRRTTSGTRMTADATAKVTPSEAIQPMLCKPG